MTCVYRRDEQNMSGSRPEVQSSKEEGVQFLFGRQRVEIIRSCRVGGVKIVTTQFGAPDRCGRRTLSTMHDFSPAVFTSLIDQWPN